MAIKNKNLMMSLTESLNENKKQEIANFKKLKEATEDNVSYVRYLLDTAEDMDDVQQAIYQIDDSALENEVQLMFDSCSEDDSLEEVISLVVSTMEDNAEYDEEMNESDDNQKVILKDVECESYQFDELKNILDNSNVKYKVNKDEPDDEGYYIASFDIYGTEKDMRDVIEKLLNTGYWDDSSVDEWMSYTEKFNESMNEDVPMDEPSPEESEDDRKNTLIAKKDELESRLGDILQSIKDKQMDTEEFRKLSREAAGLDSQIMDLDNQIRGVYECDKQINESELFNMDVYKDLEDEDENVDVEKLKMMQDYVVRKTKEIINYVYYYAPYSGIGDNMLNDMLNVIKEYLPNMNESINESDEDVKKGIVDQLVSAGMTKEQAEQTAKGICNIFKNKVGSNQVVNEDVKKENKQFPITLKNANVIDFKGIPVEVIYNFDSVQEMVNIYVEQTGKSIDVLSKEEIDYTLINTDFSHTTLTKYELIKENETKFYIIEELWGVGDEIGATLYLSNEEIKTTDINDLILQADEASRATLHEFSAVNESVNRDGFPNSDELQKYFIGLSELPDEVEIDNVKYKMEQYGGSGDNCYAIYTDINNNDSYIKVFYSLNKIENGSYKGISKINGVSDLRESAKPIKEAAITEKNLLKSQGNVYMFECKGNSDFSHIVGENYNEEENTLENVETYNNKEDADKDYLGRCEITKEGTDINESSDDNKAEQLISTLKKELPEYDWDYRFEDDQIVFYDKNEDFDFSNIDVNYEKVDDIIKSIFGKESYVDAQTPVIGVVAQ